MTATGALAPSRRIDSTWALRMSAVALLVLLRVVALVVVLDSNDAYKRTSAFGFDTARYHHIADETGVPYRDFEVEYPPGALAFVEAANGPTAATTMQNVGVTMLLLDFAVAAAMAYGWGRRAAVAYLLLGLPLMFPAFIYFRVDLLSVALAMWGLAFLKRRRDVGGGVLLGLAVLTKFWPLAVLPALLIRRQWRAAGATLATAAAGGLAWIAWSGLDGPRQVLTFRGATGWNVESVVGGFLRIVEGGTIFRELGALRTGNIPGWASPLLALALVAIVGAIWWRVSHVRAAAPGIVDGVVPVTAICAFLVFSPVLSPQYVVWLLPFGAICWVQGQRVTAGFVGAAIVATVALTKTYSGMPSAAVGTYTVLTIRNLLLLVIIVHGFAVVRAARRGEAQSTFPGADGAPLMSSMR